MLEPTNSTPPAAPDRTPEPADPGHSPPAEIPESLRRRALRRPSLSVILGQAFRDFVGKDVQQTTTYSYVWSADQSGHFMLGFVPTFLVYWFFAALYQHLSVTTWYVGEYGMVHAALTVMVAWTMLELYDLYDSIAKIRRSTGYFRPNTLNLIWNVVTALFYFGLGAAVAGVSSFGPTPALLTFTALFFVQLPMAIWWLRSKIIFQQAGLPYLYRLPNYDGVFNLGGESITSVKGGSEAQQRVVDFINRIRAEPANPMATQTGEPVNRQHLVVAGPQNSGKTSLGVGIGTEFAFVGGIGRYITMSDLVQIVGSHAALALEAGSRAGDREAPPRRWLGGSRGSLPSARGRTAAPQDNEFNDGRILWRWASVDLLVIDDVVELLLPARRALETRLRGDRFRQEVEHELFHNHPRLLELLGGEAKAREILNETIGEIQSRLRVLASPEVVARYVAESFSDVIGVIKKIPRVVWVLGDMIMPDLFEKFVRREFDFGDGNENLLLLELLPPPANVSSSAGEAGRPADR